MRFRTSLLGLICYSFVLLPACIQQTERPSEPVSHDSSSIAADVEAVRRVNVDLIDAFNAGDVSAAVSLVMDDAVDLPPHRPAVIGKKAIRSFLQSDLNQFSMNFADQIVEIEVVGDLAVIWSNYTVRLTPKGDGESVENQGKWLKVLRRQPNGSWKFSRNIWNSDNPYSERPAT